MSDPRALRIGFVGAGRVGKALAKAFGDAGFDVAATASRTRASAEALAELAPGSRAMASGQEVAEASDLVFLTCPDGAIAEVAASIRWPADRMAVHCSGATEVAALAAAEQAGAAIGGFHPMQSFTDPVAAARSLPGCTITVEAAGQLDRQLVALAEALGCRVNRLPPGKRALYHASAGYGSQFLNVLVAETAEIWAGWGASEEDVVRALLPMVRGTLASIESAGVAEGMPGPVSRGDLETVAGHVRALGMAGDDRLRFYTHHCLRSVDLARRAGRIDETTAARFREILG